MKLVKELKNKNCAISNNSKALPRFGAAEFFRFHLQNVNIALNTIAVRSFAQQEDGRMEHAQRFRP